MSPRERELPGWLSGALALGTFVTLLWLERRRPLRARRASKPRRDARNLAVAALSAATISAVEEPVVAPLARLVARRRWGLLPALRLPPALEVALGVVLLDHTLYVWHVLTHRVPFIWRFHRAHHADLDLSASTALRFHFAEMALSVPWRAAQVLVVGAGPLTLTTWQLATLLAILFHHADVDLGERVDRALSRVIVTPRLHGIHHSIFDDERDSNWGTIFTWPDVVHGTSRDDVPQGAIRIGVMDRQADVPLVDVLAMPFVRAETPTVRDEARRLGPVAPAL
jgi:sterol desaturase/sphingolipid hydroxylase (fatty acid hydroxylase superfamily)